MSDLVSSMLSTAQKSSGTSSSSQTQSELLVESYKQSQQTKVTALETKISNYETKQTFFNTLNSKINALESCIDTFTASNAESKFITRSVTSSDTSVLTASADSDAIPGISIVKVNRLATNDVLIGSKLSRTDLFGFTGTITLNMNANSTTDSDTDDDNVDPVSITFDNANMTNEEALKKISSAINERTDLGFKASYIKDSNTTGRLTFASEETGSDYALKIGSITGATDEVLTKLGLNASRSATASDAAHYKHSSIGTLDCEVDVNGVTCTRNSNDVEDIIPGVTLNLVKTDDTEVVIKTSVNSSAVESLINPILTAYNDVLTYLQGKRVANKDESSVSSLMNNLRSISTRKMSDQGTTSDPRYLTDIGIKIGSDGQLSIGDSTKLSDILKKDGGAQKVAALFIGKKDKTDPSKSYGLAARLTEAMQSMVGYTDDNGNAVAGIIKNRTLALSKQKTQTETKKEELEARIDKQAETLRKQYESTLSLYLEAQSQSSLFSSLSS